jgi:hypothetical protein
MIQELRRPYSLYLSIPQNIFEEIFDVAVMRVITESKIDIVVINLELEVIVKWIKSSN